MSIATHDPTTARRQGSIWDYVSASVALPVGNLHGPRDRVERVSPARLYEQFAIALELLRERDEQARKEWNEAIPWGRASWKAPGQPDSRWRP